MYKLSRKIAYLKSEFVEIGRFWDISGLFLDSAQFCRFFPGKWEAGLNYSAPGDGAGRIYAPGDGWGLINTPEAVGGAYHMCPRRWAWFS